MDRQLDKQWRESICNDGKILQSFLTAFGFAFIVLGLGLEGGLSLLLLGLGLGGRRAGL